MDQFSLVGKTAVITGCNRGLGLGLSRGLAESGADIVGIYRSDPGAAPEAVSAVGRTFTAYEETWPTVVSLRK